MNYNGIDCPVCGKKFEETDDVVVCPVCGTPQHRDCWKANGKCINDDKHAEGFGWQMPASAHTNIENTPSPDNKNVKICPACGAGNDITEPVCTRCGARLKNWAMPPFTAEISEDMQGSSHWQAPPAMQYNPHHNVYAQDAKTVFGEEAKIEDIPVTECAEYIQKDANKYIGKFITMQETKSKLSWNWSAGLASVFWCFYRKMIGLGISFMAIFFSVYLVSSVVPALICQQVRPDIYAEYHTTLEELNKEMTAMLEEGYSDSTDMTRYYQLVGELIKSPVNIAAYIIQMATVLIMSIVMGFFGNHFYKKKMLKDIRTIRRISSDNMVYHLYLTQRGNVSVINLLLPVLCYMLFTMMTTYI